MKNLILTILLSAMTISYVGAQELILDGDFEVGSPSTDWVEFELLFGTPLCTIVGCGTGTGTGPNSGDWWAWFGGVGAFTEGSLTQTFNAPSAGTADLTFQFESIVCDSPSDYIEVLIDGNQVWTMDGSSANCGVLGYSLMSVPAIPLTAGPHTIEIHSEIFASNGGGSNFFVDDVSLNFIPPPPPIPTMGQWGVMALGLILMIFSLIAIRQRVMAKA